MVSGLKIRQKQSFRPWLWLFWAIVAVVLAASAWFTYRWYTTGQMPPMPIAHAIAVTPGVSEKPVTKDAISSYTVPALHPRYISIPSLDVGKTRVFPVGVDKNNVLGTPNNISDAAWYDKSMTPGSGYGAVLIDAHNGGYTRDGIFANLYKIKPGDTVTVERGDGELFTYKVVSNVTMSLQDVNKYGMSEMMQSADENKEGLSLITCAGNYVPKLGQFDKRVMVRAVRVE